MDHHITPPRLPLDVLNIIIQANADYEEITSTHDERIEREEYENTKRIMRAFHAADSDDSDADSYHDSSSDDDDIGYKIIQPSLRCYIQLLALPRFARSTLTHGVYWRIQFITNNSEQK
jgi:hypothetical protein